MVATIEENHHLNPFPWYRRMRKQSPIAYDEASGVISVFSYEEVRRVLSDYSTFSSRMGLDDQDPEHPIGGSLILTDPPRHHQLRDLVTKVFTPKTIMQLAPRIEELVNEFLDKVIESGQMNIITDLAYPLPITIIAELLGIPSEERENFKRWSDGIVAETPLEEAEGSIQTRDAETSMAMYFLQVIERFRRKPNEGLISQLLVAEIDGRRLSKMELLSFCVLLLIAGHETTTNLIGNGLICFDEHPGTWQRLAEERELLPTAIEEVLRYRGPVQKMHRLALKETTLGGQRVVPGQHIIAWLGSANRDESVFPDAERFDIARTPNKHLTFGYGIHFCLGAHLARLEGRIALNVMLQRLKDIRLLPGQQEPFAGSNVFGMRSLPAQFTIRY